MSINNFTYKKLSALCEILFRYTYQTLYLAQVFYIINGFKSFVRDYLRIVGSNNLVDL